MKTLDSLTADRNRLNCQISALEEEQRDKVARPLLRKSVGKCFIYDNGYNNTERWPLYIKIVSFDEKAMTFETVQIQQTSHNEIRFEHRVQYNFRGENYFDNHSYVPIPISKFNAEARKALRLATKILKGMRSQD